MPSYTMTVVMALLAVLSCDASDTIRDADVAFASGSTSPGAVQSADGDLAPHAADDGTQLVEQARRMERVGATDSARAMYLHAAYALPLVADWLHLRAAALTRDSATRASLYAALTTSVARAYTRRAEAEAMERSGRPMAAAALYESLGMPVEAVRLRFAIANDSGRAALRRRLVSLIASGSGDARPATELFDRLIRTPSRAEELTLARTAARLGPASRAAAGFARAASSGGLGAQDRFTYGTILSQLGRERDAARQFAAVRTPALAGRASYRRARSLLRAGDGAHARAALDSVIRRFPDDTSAASSAHFLLADLAVDDGRDSVARALFQTVGHRYPTSELAPQARFRAALIAFVAGQPGVAAREFDSLAAIHPRSDEVLSATYWAGRSWATLGDTMTAAKRWRAVILRDPQSYYAVLARRRLATPAWRPVKPTDSLPRLATVDSGIARAELLERVGLTAEAGREQQHLVRAADASITRLLVTARALEDAGSPSRAMPLARQAIARGAAEARAYRLLYPLTTQDELGAAASAHGVDRALVAALIRQESGFNPRATSRVGARGLMQIMPDVGRQLAAARGFTDWDPSLLYRPEVNLRLGVAHLAGLLQSYREVPRVLAAYNAGSARVDRWSSRTGVDDPEVFVERIPFVETRDYVRIVQRNHEVYRALYDAADD